MIRLFSFVRRAPARSFRRAPVLPPEFDPMDALEDLRSRSRSLDSGSQSEMLDGYRRLVAENDEPSAAVLARAGELELRCGDPAVGARHLARAAGLYAEAGLLNLALALCHRLLRLDPPPTDEYLRLGELSAAQGYARDARLGYVEYAERRERAGDTDAARSALEAYLRAFPADAAVQRRLADLSGSALPSIPSATEAPRSEPAEEPAEVPDADLGILPTLLEETSLADSDAFDVAPLEGLESNRADDASLTAPPPAASAGDPLPLLRFESGFDSLVTDVAGQIADAGTDTEALPLLTPEMALESEPERAKPEESESWGGEEPDGRGLGDQEPEGEDLKALERRLEQARRAGDREQTITAYLELGRRHEADLDSVRAREAFQGAADLDPENREARQALSLLLPPAGLAREYVDLGALVLSEDMDLPDLVHAPSERPAGAMAIDLEEILGLFGEAVAQKIDPKEATGHYDLGLAFKEMGLFDDAITQLQGALRGGANPLATLEVLGECFIHRGDPAFARRILQHATLLDTTDGADLIGVLYWLGRGHEALGDAEQARAAYERALARDAGFRDTAARLAALPAAGFDKPSASS